MASQLTRNRPWMKRMHISGRQFRYTHAFVRVQAHAHACVQVLPCVCMRQTPAESWMTEVLRPWMLDPAVGQYPPAASQFEQRCLGLGRRRNIGWGMPAEPCALCGVCQALISGPVQWPCSESQALFSGLGLALFSGPG